MQSRGECLSPCCPAWTSYETTETDLC
uniref:Uncharacterized protein n=1 Tax=Arundo donax TaxID=35708 RepID=A0A0A9AS74_ARUDO